MHPYEIITPSAETKARLKADLFGLDRVPELADPIVTAWASALAASAYETLAEVPFSVMADYSLLDHVNEVTRTGLSLAERAGEFWGETFDMNVLVPILMLHDVDKPLMTVRNADGKAESSHWSKELPHGVLGAMILKDLGFDHIVVSTVSTHSSVAPFHGRNREAYILHYADFFSADNAIMRSGGQPFYQRHWR